MTMNAADIKSYHPLLLQVESLFHKDLSRWPLKNSGQGQSFIYTIIPLLLSFLTSMFSQI